MQTITVENEWLETAQLFGDAERVVKDALQSYFVEKCRQKIQEATEQLAVYYRKYGMDYKTFKTNVQTDETYLERLEVQYPLWEEDAMEWEFWEKENNQWRARLEAILKR